jgi:TolA-binding protein
MRFEILVSHLILNLYMIKFSYFKKAGLCVCLFLWLMIPAYGQQETFHKAQQQMLKLRFTEADRLIASSRESDPYLIYLRSLSLAARLLITEKQELWKEGEKQFDQLEALIEKAETEESQPLKDFLQAELQLHRGLCHLQMDEMLTGGWHIWKAYHELSGIRQSYPSFIPAYRSLGFLQLMIANVPPKYQWLASLLGLKANRQEGLKNLNAAVNLNHPLQKESKLLILVVQAYLMEQHKDASYELKTAFEQEPDNLLYAYLLSSVLMKSAQTAEAFQVFRHADSLRNQPQYLSFPFLDYLKAEAYLQSGDYKLAAQGFEDFIHGFQGRHHLKSAYYKAALAYHLLNQADKARNYLELGRQNGSTYSENDRYAARMLEEAELPEPLLLKLRFYTDGGFYTKADSLIALTNTEQFLTLKEQTEWIYRLGRLCHKQEDRQQAVRYYRKTIELSSSQHWYFAPNAALQAGYIYHKQYQLDSAQYFFEKVLQFEDYPYESSIRRKAELGVSLVRNN